MSGKHQLEVWEISLRSGKYEWKISMGSMSGKYKWEVWEISLRSGKRELYKIMHGRWIIHQRAFSVHNCLTFTLLLSQVHLFYLISLFFSHSFTIIVIMFMIWHMTTSIIIYK